MMSFPKYCSQCGQPFSINHKCEAFAIARAFENARALSAHEQCKHVVVLYLDNDKQFMYGRIGSHPFAVVAAFHNGQQLSI